MNTPICDFIKKYSESESIRLHMPGHKGTTLTGPEALDITEISGADSLYEASGIIRESEQNASLLFGCDTYYSTEGSSQCIKAMLYLMHIYAKTNHKNPLILAGRNAHRAFISGLALTDMQVEWIYPEEGDNYLRCNISPKRLESILKDMTDLPVAVYLTSPDYLGNICDVTGLAQVCHKYGVLLLVDNAHGAYLRFEEESGHPTDLGADMCCDSAHKTLPVLTGGAYLHISHNLSTKLGSYVRGALSLFGSTSPSYLILSSLDAANKYLSERYRDALKLTSSQIRKVKDSLLSHGYTLCGEESLKITLQTKDYGYTGLDFAEILAKNNIICEFADPDFVVLMMTPMTSEAELLALEQVLLSIPSLPAIISAPPLPDIPERVTTVREAIFSQSESIPVSEALGRILADTCIGCPPAVPVLVSGERITPAAIRCFEYYSIETCRVVKDET
ncbi:MAG: aminotransferase class V-fold PLP-dependent enzyme [Ruminococcus sp.]|nr:aminotransferase class V-fold PLP-dependent enzyme [Ruminococcus sp.]